MRTLIHIIYILFLIALCGCKSDRTEFEITDVHFKENIYKPQYMNYDYGLPICSKSELNKYRLKRLGQKVRVTHYKKSIRIEILDANIRKEFILDYKDTGKYSGDGIDAAIDETLFHNTIVMNINAQEELDVNLTIFKKYDELNNEQRLPGLNERFWLMNNKSIIITAKTNMLK